MTSTPEGEPRAISNRTGRSSADIDADFNKIATDPDYLRIVTEVQKAFEASDRAVDRYVFLRDGDGEKVNPAYLDASENAFKKCT
jgi:hypothetical protein